MMLESLMLGIAGIVLGVVVGLALVTIYGHVGIDLSQMAESMERFYIDPVIYTEVDTDHLLDTILIMLFGNLLASIYPAWKASRLTPVEAIHHV
jgi:ABC-type lipoprotein release transport system permease subunit